MIAGCRTEMLYRFDCVAEAVLSLDLTASLVRVTGMPAIIILIRDRDLSPGCLEIQLPPTPLQLAVPRSRAQLTEGV